MDCSPGGSPVHGILQPRMLEWVAISNFKGLPNPGIKPRSPALQADSLLSATREALMTFIQHEGSRFYTLSPAFIVCVFFDDGHSDWYEVIPHCSLDLHFSNN